MTSIGGSCGAGWSSVITFKQKRLNQSEAAEMKGNGNLTGARMKMPMKGTSASRSPLTSSGASKDSTCVPRVQYLRTPNKSV